MSSSIYNTFGSDIQFRYNQGVLEAYFENASVKFPLPEATSDILSQIAVPAETPIDSQTLEAVKTKLVSIGFGKYNANAMAKVLIQVAKVQNISPMDYFKMNENSLKLSIDSYSAINSIRPQGNKIDLKSPILNSRSKLKSLIQP